MITEDTILAIKHHLEEIFEAEGVVRIVCNKYVYYMDKTEITSYCFDHYGISLMGKIRCVYQCSCTFSRVYIPAESITALTGKDI